MSTPSTTPPSGRQALVAALQWGLVQASLVAAVGDLLAGYYDLTTDAFFAPSWVQSVGFAVPVVFLVGLYGGYTWVTEGYAEATHEAHRARIRFLVALVGLWLVHFLAELLLLVAVDSALLRAFAPPAFTLAVLGGAYLLAYRVDPATFVRVQERLAPTGRRVDSE